jgi:hypothetical protein
MTLQRVEALFKYWRKHPPVSINVGRLAAYFGLTPQDSSSETPPTPIPDYED